MFLLKSKRLIPFIFALLLVGCSNQETGYTGYYPIEEFLNNQISYLASVGATLSKQAEIDGEQESVTLIPSDTAWHNELDIFIELKTINKTINKGSYTVENGLNDPFSNLTVKSITANETDLPVQYLKIYYHESENNVRKIEALFHEENSLLKGSRFLVMEFREIYNKTVLTSYSIEGGQQMFLGDSVQFSIKGSVTIP